jgi:uncharacterized protein
LSEAKRALAMLQAGYKAWNDTKGESIDTWLDIMADQVDFGSLSNGGYGVPWTNPRASKSDIRGYLTALTAAFQMRHYTVDRFVCEGDTVVMIGRTAWHNIKTGKVIDTPKVDIWRFRDGKAVAFFEYLDTAALAESTR